MSFLKKTFLFIGCLCLCAADFYASSPFSIHVDTQSRVRGDGSVEKPFQSFSHAVVALEKYSHRTKSTKNSTPVCVYIHANTFINELVLLTVPIKIIGRNNPTISFAENTGIFAQNTVVKIEDCRIRRSEKFTEPRTVPLIYGSNSRITLNNVIIDAQEGGDAVILRKSTLMSKQSWIESSQHSLALLLRAEASQLTLINTYLYAEGVFGLIFSLTNTRCTVKDTECRLICENAGKIAELYHSQFTADGLKCKYESPLPQEEKDAVTADQESTVVFQHEPELNGFVKSEEPELKKADEPREQTEERVEGSASAELSNEITTVLSQEEEAE